MLSLLISGVKLLKSASGAASKNDKDIKMLHNLADSVLLLSQSINFEIASEVTKQMYQKLVDSISSATTEVQRLEAEGKLKKMAKASGNSENIQRLCTEMVYARDNLNMSLNNDGRNATVVNDTTVKQQAQTETDKQIASDRAAVLATFRKLSEMEAATEVKKSIDRRHENQDAVEWLFKTRQADLRPIIPRAVTIGDTEGIFDPLIPVWKIVCRDEIKPAADPEELQNPDEIPAVVHDATVALVDMYGGDIRRFNSFADQYAAQGLFHKVVPYLEALVKDNDKDHIMQIYSLCQMLEILVRDNEMRSVALAFELGSEVFIKMVKKYSTNMQLHIVVLRILWSLAGPRGASKHIMVDSLMSVGAEIFTYTMMLWSTNDEVLQTACSALRRLAAHEPENAVILARNGVASAVANFLRSASPEYMPMTLTVTMGFEVLTALVVNAYSATHVIEALGGFQPIQFYLRSWQSFPFVFFSGCNLILRLLANLTNGVKYVEEAGLVQHITSLTFQQKEDIVICTPLMLTIRKLSGMDDIIKMALYNAGCADLVLRLMLLHGNVEAFGSQCIETLINLKQLNEIKLLISQTPPVMHLMFQVINSTHVQAVVRINCIYLACRCFIRAQLDDLPTHEIITGFINSVSAFVLTRDERSKYKDEVTMLIEAVEALAYNLSDHINADMEMRLLSFALILASDEMTIVRHAKIRDDLRKNKQKDEKENNLSVIIFAEDRMLCNLIFGDESYKTTEEEIANSMCCSANESIVNVEHDDVLETIGIILRGACPIRYSPEKDMQTRIGLVPAATYRTVHVTSSVNHQVFYSPACFRAMIYALGLRCCTRNFPYHFWNYYAWDYICEMMERMPNDFGVQYYGILGLYCVLVDTYNPSDELLARGTATTETALLLYPRSDIKLDWCYFYTPTGTLNILRCAVIRNINHPNKKKRKTIYQTRMMEKTKINAEIAEFRAANEFQPNIMKSEVMRNPNWTNPAVPSLPPFQEKSKNCGRCNEGKTKGQCAICGLGMCKACTYEGRVRVPYVDGGASICYGCWNCEPLQPVQSRKYTSGGKSQYGAPDGGYNGYGGDMEMNQRM